MGKTKRAALVVRKNKRQYRRLLKSIVGYLESDCYIFAPLISASPPPSDPGAQTPSSASGAELNRRKNKRRMLEKVEEFLKSDYHMYGSTIPPQKLSPPLKGHLQCTNRVTMEVSTSAIVMEDDQLGPPPKNVVRKDGYCKRSHTKMSIQASGPDETVKRIFRQRCRSSSLPEEEMTEPELRRVTID